MIGVNCMSLSLLQRMQIVLKDTVLQIYKPDFVSKFGHACIFYFGDDQNQSTLPQVHALVAYSSPPVSIMFSHAHQWDSTRSFSMNQTQMEDDYWLAPFIS